MDSKKCLLSNQEFKKRKVKVVGIKFCGISDGVDDCAAPGADKRANSEIRGSLFQKKKKKETPFTAHKADSAADV
ncbi:hypothetical protein GJB61_22355 [Paenibacillus sp. LC-T2]|uniref:Uncharacterized protein n=1 Tax=Paenibacillus monticola TaxID=2666075 RepID=A0A7X2HAA9_9BACL|nr:hypothetical protein [Paenibacillus monticola]